MTGTGIAVLLIWTCQGILLDLTIGNGWAYEWDSGLILVAVRQVRVVNGVVKGKRRPGWSGKQSSVVPR